MSRSQRNGRRGNGRRGGGSDYDSMGSPGPGGLDDERYRQLVTEVSKGIGYFNQLTKSIEQKMGLFGTKQDNRGNHKKINEEVDKGKKVTVKVKRRLKELSNAGKGCSSSIARSRATQHRKLTNDFRYQMEDFEDVCKRVMSSERNAVDHIRRSSVPKQKSQPFDYKNYTEDQLYAQVSVTNYDEDDLARREGDIIHISHQIKEVNAAYREIDGLITDQDEMVIEITDNTDTAKERTDRALDQVRQADEKTKYCNCSKRKCCCLGIVIVILGIMFGALILTGND